MRHLRYKEKTTVAAPEDDHQEQSKTEGKEEEGN